MRGVRTLEGFLKALPPGARRNSRQLCLTSSPPSPFCLLKFLSLVLTCSPVFSLVLFLFLSSTFFLSLSHEHLPVLLPSLASAHFFFSSPSISSPSSALPPKKKLSLLHVPTRHLLSQGPPSAGTGEGRMQTGTAGVSKQFGSSKSLLPSVLVNEELAESFRDDGRQDKGPAETVRAARTPCVIPLSPNATLVARSRFLPRLSESHQRSVKGEEQDSEGSLSKTSWHPQHIVLFAVLQGSACSFRLPCAAQGRAGKQ